MCLHTILLDPAQHGRMFAAISAAGAFRSDDAGQTWRPVNQGLQSEGIPDPDAEVEHCVHRLAMHPSRPDVLFMQKHWDVMRSDNGGESWREISGNLPSDFGFPIDVHAHEPDTIYVVPITSDAEHFPPEGKLRVYRSRAGGDDWQPLTTGLPQENCYVNVLRDAMAVNSLDSCGVYFGTTGGQIYASADSGVPSSGSSLASWTCPMTRPTTPCPTLSPPGQSPILSSARWQEDKSAGQPGSLRYGTRGMVLGAVVLIISDGWETGDPSCSGGRSPGCPGWRTGSCEPTRAPSRRTGPRSAAWPRPGRTATPWSARTTWTPCTTCSPRSSELSRGRQPMAPKAGARCSGRSGPSSRRLPPRSVTACTRPPSPGGP